MPSNLKRAIISSSDGIVNEPGYDVSLVTTLDLNASTSVPYQATQQGDVLLWAGFTKGIGFGNWNAMVDACAPFPNIKYAYVYDEVFLGPNGTIVMGLDEPAINLGQTYSSGAVIGDEINVGNRWADFGLQTDYGTRYTVGLQLVPDVLPASDGVNTKTCTMTSGTPGVVSLTAHGFTAYMGVVFAANGGTLPAAITAGNVYYVVASPTANTFGISATIGGAVITFATSSTGSPTVLPSYPGSFGEAFGPSVWGHQWWVNKLTRPNTLCAGGVDNLAWGGSLATLAPGAWAQLRGFWGLA